MGEVCFFAMGKFSLSGSTGASRRCGLAVMTAVLMAAFCGAARAQDSDSEGCKDSPLISRYPKAFIESCDHKEFDSANMEINKEGEQKGIEGDVTTLGYTIPEGVSDLAIYRNMHNALASAGYTFLYEESPYKFTAKKGGQYIALSEGGGETQLTLVKVQAMAQVVTADAKSMNDALDSAGHVAVYGIEFATGKADLLPAADAPLQQMLILLKDNAGLKLRVEGHTDNVGARAMNQRLSEQRAAAVVAWLVTHGIAKDRLTAQGFADTKPVEDNSTEEGRAKNRRVELVKI
jgi:OmpA-OmpF porin, OOP family